MVRFHGICHKNCALKYVGEILETRKLHFRGRIGQFDVKKANFRGLIAKIGHYWPILATRTHLWHIFMEYAMGIVPYWRGSSAQKIKLWGSQRSI